MTLRIGMIGTGGFSRKHAGHLTAMDGVKVQAICGTKLEKAEKMAVDFEGAAAYSEVKEMLDKERLDAVYICVPPMAHGEIELDLIDRRIPFLVEKPLGVDKGTVERIHERLKQQPLITSVGYHFRYAPSAEVLKTHLGDATIGLISGQWMGDMPEVPWWRKQEGSGGQFMEQTTHIVDLMRYIAGEVTEVYASYANRVNHKKFEGVTVADVGTVNLKLESGAVASLSNVCILPSGVDRVGMTVYTDQTIIDWQPEAVTVTGKEGTAAEALQKKDPYVLESEAFLHAVRTGDASGILSDYKDAYKTHLVTWAALTSAQTGSAVKLS
ncbi:Gfo/Idh/MocA family protein [Alkalicoccus halolimnae]|uniref:Gfo/Idh/MocA family oxidoreductase n=1 Tax=Alkalicoccus halolimnae TaxID=1667239 RepID=A0A5C7FBC8_9BACI|nr:Gfo/Idh/MocA family oxidoreductase [Alkalicoccus halolimnae]TXF86780.1 Gfo/Idh/MocA family oxidoreductase [Alkalicoccus halolimnae]